jgi:hypothetical protein
LFALLPLQKINNKARDNNCTREQSECSGLGHTIICLLILIFLYFHKWNTCSKNENETTTTQRGVKGKRQRAVRSCSLTPGYVIMNLSKMLIKHFHTLPECKTEPMNGTEKL